MAQSGYHHDDVTKQALYSEWVFGMRLQVDEYVTFAEPEVGAVGANGIAEDVGERCTQRTEAAYLAEGLAGEQIEQGRWVVPAGARDGDRRDASGNNLLSGKRARMVKIGSHAVTRGRGI